MNYSNEFVVFKFNDGLSKEEELELMQRIDSCTKIFEGFVGRKFYYSEKDRYWIDHVQWENDDYAKIASEQIINDPVAAEIFSKIDQSSILMSHYQEC